MHTFVTTCLFCGCVFLIFVCVFLLGFVLGFFVLFVVLFYFVFGFNTSATLEIVPVNFFVAKRTFCVGSSYFYMS